MHQKIYIQYHTGHKRTYFVQYFGHAYFPFRKRGEERVLSLSGASFLSGREKLYQEIPIPPEVEEWVNIAQMQYNVETSEDQQELED